MIIVHHLNNSRSQRILWLLEELGLEYEVKRYDRSISSSKLPNSNAFREATLTFQIEKSDCLQQTKGHTDVLQEETIA